MRRRGRRNVSRQIRRRRHHWPAEGAQDLPRQRMRRHPDRHGIEPGGGKIGHRAVLRARQYQRQRSRPERFGQCCRGRVEAPNPPGSLEVADMGDQRIERRPALGLVEPCDRYWVGGVGAEAIDGLGREPDQATFRQATRRRGHGSLVGGQNWRCQAHIHGNWHPQFGFLRCAKPKAISRVLVGVWLSPVEHCVRDAGVAGSNPATPTKISLGFCPFSRALSRSTTAALRALPRS